MKITFLTSGPRGSGKSVYVKEEKVRHPETIIISRDELLISLFGKTSLSPYEDGHKYVSEILFQKVQECLSMDILGLTMILDYWNGFSNERRVIIKKLRNLGADKVYCLQFITPLDTCIEWFMQKPDSSGYSENSVLHDFQLYHKEAINIEEDGFDRVIQINPLQFQLELNPPT